MDLKFKVWNKELKKMRNVISMYWVKGKLNCYTDEFDYELISVDDIELLQYTNKKDKNDSRVCNGDILQDDEDKEMKYLVRYNEKNDMFVLDVYGIKGCLMEYGFDENAGGYGFIESLSFDYFEDFNMFEIIGNIYENPELLKVV